MCLWIFIAFFFGILLAGWAALITQSVAGGGKFKTFFASRLKFEAPPDDDDVVVLTSPFVFSDSTGRKFVAPARMESDGASVGALLRWPFLSDMVTRLIKGGPLEGPLRPAAIAHDGIYARAEEETFWPALISSKRAIADRVIYEAAQCGEYRLLAEGRIPRIPLAKWRAFVVMALLRLAGWKAWISDSRASRSLAKKA